MKEALYLGNLQHNDENFEHWQRPGNGKRTKKNQDTQYVYTVCITRLLIEPAQSKWLDIGQFFFTCLRSETESKSMNTQKGTKPISSHLMIWKKIEHCLFSSGTQRVIPNRQDSTILPSRVANHSVELFCYLSRLQSPHTVSFI